MNSTCNALPLKAATKPLPSSACRRLKNGLNRLWQLKFSLTWGFQLRSEGRKKKCRQFFSEPEIPIAER